MSLKLRTFSIAAGATTGAALVVGRGFLSATMQPEAVANTLLTVEDEWQAQANDFAKCNATVTEGDDCSASKVAFEKSCTTVVAAIVQASAGDRSVVSEYMADICAEASLKGWRQEQCKNLAEHLDRAMTEDSYDNRERLSAVPLCQGFWTQFAADEQSRAAAEAAEREAQEKKAAEEQAAKEAAEKQAAEEAQAREQQAQQEMAEREKQQAEEALQQAQKQNVTAEATAASDASNNSTPELGGSVVPDVTAMNTNSTEAVVDVPANSTAVNATVAADATAQASVVAVPESNVTVNVTA